MNAYFNQFFDKIIPNANGIDAAVVIMDGDIYATAHDDYGARVVMGEISIMRDNVAAYNAMCDLLRTDDPRGPLATIREWIAGVEDVSSWHEFPGTAEQFAAELDSAMSVISTVPTTTGIIAAARKTIERQLVRSAWARGVNAYALELLDNLTECTPQQLATPAAVRVALLNDAPNWAEYSRGGCALIYDPDIAARVCTPSELRRTRNAERNPNRREKWLDVQARALSQAAQIVCEAVGKVMA